MMLHIPQVLSKEETADIRRLLESSQDWVDGRETVGVQGAQVKRNQQLADSSELKAHLGQRVTAALQQHPLFFAAALPLRIIPPRFNRYAGGETYGMHVDGSVMQYTDLNGQSQTPVHALRRQAIDRFAATGFPTGRDEDWRHTNLSPITRIQFQPWSQDQTGLLQPADIAPYLVAGLAAHRLVFVNGQFDAALSDAPGADGEVAAGSLRDAVALDSGLAEHLGRNSARGGFDALNTAFLDDGAFVHVAAGVRAQMPIQLLFVTAPTIGSGSAAGVPTVSFPRTLVMLEAGAEATVVETYAGGGDVPYLTDAATEVFLGARSRLEHCRIQRESAAAFHVSRSHFHEEGESRLDSHSVDLGTRLCRNDIVTRLLGAGVKSILNGLYVTAGDQHVDNHTLIDHAAPGCESHELFKGVLGERSKAVFRGKIHVHLGNQHFCPRALVCCGVAVS